MRKVYQVIETQKWTDGAGWGETCELDWGNPEIEISDDMMDSENFDWSWYYEDSEEFLNDGIETDTEVTVRWYNNKEDKEPIFETSIFESILRNRIEKKRNNKLTVSDRPLEDLIKEQRLLPMWMDDLIYSICCKIGKENIFYDYDGEEICKRLKEKEGIDLYRDAAILVQTFETWQDVKAYGTWEKDNIWSWDDTLYCLNFDLLPDKVKEEVKEAYLLS